MVLLSKDHHPLVVPLLGSTVSSLTLPPLAIQLLANSTIVVPLARSINTIVEPKLEPDPIEEILMLTQEEMAQPFSNHEHFVKEEEELVEPVELDKNEQPSPPSIELKPLTSGLRYVFLHNNSKTPVIISDKLSDYETQQLVTVLERHR